MRIVILASGSGSLAQAIFDADLALEILQVISDKPSQVLARAELAGIPTTYLPVEGDRDTWDAQLFTLVESLNPDLVVSVGFMRILSAKFVNRFATINTHPAYSQISLAHMPFGMRSQLAYKQLAQLCTGLMRAWIRAKSSHRRTCKY